MYDDPILVNPCLPGQLISIPFPFEGSNVGTFAPSQRPIFQSGGPFQGSNVGTFPINGTFRSEPEPSLRPVVGEAPPASMTLGSSARPLGQPTGLTGQCPPGYVPRVTLPTTKPSPIVLNPPTPLVAPLPPPSNLPPYGPSQVPVANQGFIPPLGQPLGVSLVNSRPPIQEVLPEAGPLYDIDPPFEGSGVGTFPNTQGPIFQSGAPFQGSNVDTFPGNPRDPIASNPVFRSTPGMASTTTSPTSLTGMGGSGINFDPGPPGPNNPPYNPALRPGISGGINTGPTQTIVNRPPGVFAPLSPNFAPQGLRPDYDIYYRPRPGFYAFDPTPKPPPKPFEGSGVGTSNRPQYGPFVPGAGIPNQPIYVPSFPHPYYRSAPPGQSSYYDGNPYIPGPAEPAIPSNPPLPAGAITKPMDYDLGSRNIGAGLGAFGSAPNETIVTGCFRLIPCDPVPPAPCNCNHEEIYPGCISESDLELESNNIGYLQNNNSINARYGYLMPQGGISGVAGNLLGS